jgi:hypothetical protein
VVKNLRESVSVRCSELSVPLTSAQCEIVKWPPSDRILVTAGPGTGKTHTLIARLEGLVRFHGVEPGRELLVLSFSRAVVFELKRRLRNIGGDVGYVSAFTFDSFATRLLSRFYPNGNWDSEGYDDRIVAACRLIRINKEAQKALSEYAHILVDEVQDLVGIRAEFVQEILYRSETGFTLFGDPAQGIYNFQLDDEQERRAGSRVLYDRINRHYGSSLIRYTLNENHRTLSTSAGIAATAGTLLNAIKPNYRGAANLLVTLAQDLTSLGSINRAAPRLPDLEGSTAILARTNGQVLLISRSLAAKGIPHVVRQRATDRIIASWLGRLFNNMEYPILGRAQFMNLAEKRFNGDMPELNEAWDLLKRIEGRAGNQLDIVTLARHIRIGNIPDELTQVVFAPIVVSTIHRAKGLEFDNIVLVEPDDFLNDDWFEEETRTYYVALTRARRNYYRLERPTEYGLRPTEDGRWFVRPGRWQTRSIEVRGDDVHHMDPAGSYLINGDSHRLQDYIYHEMHPGDRVRLTYLKGALGLKPHAYYQIMHNDVAVGVTGDSFSYSVYNILKIHPKWKVQWPNGFDELYVQSIDTVAGSTAAGQRVGIKSGIWLRVRVAGLATIRW